MVVCEKVMEILEDLSGKTDIKMEDELQKDLALDSLNMVMFLLDIEEAFSIILDESDMNPFDLLTVQNAVDLVNKYCAEPPKQTGETE